MTSKAALVKALLDGRTLNIKNGFDLLSITNVPREIGRAINRSFDVEVTKIPRSGVSRYGQPCVWTDYKLFKTERNKVGIDKMREYLSKNLEEYRPKQKEKTIQKNIFSEL